MASYLTSIEYQKSENTLYCDEIQLFKKSKKIVAVIDYSSNSQLRKNTSRIKLDFEELIDNLEYIKEVTCESVSKKVIRYFKTIDSEKQLKRFCTIIIGEDEVTFECSFSLSNDQLTITKK